MELVQSDGYDQPRRPRWSVMGPLAVFFCVALVGGFFVFKYGFCRIEVPSKHIAVLVKKTGKNLKNSQELAPSAEFKGLQREVLTEGRHFRSPWNWDWDVVPQVEIPESKLGVAVRLYGDNPGYGEIIAWDDDQKGIVPDVLRPGRHARNAWVSGMARRDRINYAEHIELHEPIVVPAGYKGVVTMLSGPMPENPNVLLVPEGKRGVQPETETLNPGTYYFNPYIYRVDLVDCRSKRFDLKTGGEMGFPSKDGFWVTLDGTVEFRVMPERAAHVFVTYNDETNDGDTVPSVEQEIINKIILPNARSFCRLRGSDHSGKEFISGDTRTKFQQDFQNQLAVTCESQGVQIVQALITRIHPPQKIAKPVRERQIAAQQEQQYVKQIRQQESEKELRIEQELIKRKQAMVEAERDIVKQVTEAERAQEVALIRAAQQLKVAELELQAAGDLAAAITARGSANAEVVRFNNQAEAAGWRKSVNAFNGDGDSFARWVMFKKLAPSYRQMMVNTADSPMMDIFKQFGPTTQANPSNQDSNDNSAELAEAAEIDSLPQLEEVDLDSDTLDSN